MDLLKTANELEGVLRKYLNCNYGDFGIKANDNLLSSDWKSPIFFALGHKYASAKNDKKKEIEYFLGNTLEGKSISDLVNNHEYYSCSSQEDALKKATDIIAEIDKILNR